jgi:hypothetical protein
MRRTAIVISLLVCWIAMLLGTSPAVASSATTQDELLASCQKIQRSLTLPSATSAEQSALVALSIAIAQSQPLDASVDVAEVLRKASAFTTYGVQSDTFYLWETDHWEGNHRSTNTYSGARITSDVEQDWDGASWVNASKTLTTYNGDGTLNTTTQQEWQTSQWVNTYMTTVGYSGGTMTTMLMQSWSGTAWVNSSRSTVTYSGGKLATSITENWVSSAWVNVAKALYTYTGSDLTEWIMQSWVSSAWVNSIRSIMTYNGSGDEIQSIMYSWQASAWVTTSKYDYTYDGSGNEILSVYSMAAGPSWVPMEADTSKWSSGKNTEIVHNHLVPPSVFRSQFTYDGNGNRTIDLGQDWSGSEWVNTDRAVYVYQTLAVEVDNGRIPSVFELSQNYPNPFNPITAIRYSLRRPSQVNITVFNLLGQEVKILENGFQSPGAYETTWDGTNRTGEQVASGIYFYRIKAGDNVETRKMLLLK